MRYSVAEFSKKPLYRVTCGDIGTEAGEVEKVCNPLLETSMGILICCSIWRSSCYWGKPGVVVCHSSKPLCCNLINLYVVVLLDEADVFLEQRKISDLQRNALVSGQ